MNYYIFFLTFILMEFAANLLHRFVMHGFLWSWHEDHHVVSKNLFQKNDLFVFFFALPSFLLILFGSLNQNIVLNSIGFGMTFYGLIYFFVHEIIIHQRIKWKLNGGFYFNALKKAHKDHHSNLKKENSKNFGMLLVSFNYFK